MSYTIVKVESDAVFLVDNDDGRSVTNDAEAVVSSVLQKLGNRRIFYRDTMGVWDELVHDGKRFTDFRAGTGSFTPPA